jgi:hypothetical protein
MATVHWNSAQVVGGIDKPRFLLVGPELSPNISFEDGLTGVSGSAGAYTRNFDSSTPFGDYSLKIEDTSPDSEYAEITIDTGDTIAEKRFIIFAHCRNELSSGDQQIWCVYQGISGTHEKEYTIDENWRRTIVHEIVVPADAVGNNLVYRIYPFGKAAGSAGTGAVRIDNFHCRQILAEYTMPVPDRKRQVEIFRKIKQAEHEMADRSIKTYTDGYRYYYEAGYNKITATEEYVRALITNTDNEIVFFPHLDAPHCYLVKHADDLERRWAFGSAAIGHEADIQLIGQEKLNNATAEIIDATNVYEYEEDSYVGGGGGVV